MKSESCNVILSYRPVTFAEADWSAPASSMFTRFLSQALIVSSTHLFPTKATLNLEAVQRLSKIYRARLEMLNHKRRVVSETTKVCSQVSSGDSFYDAEEFVSTPIPPIKGIHTSRCCASNLGTRPYVEPSALLTSSPA